MSDVVKIISDLESVLKRFDCKLVANNEGMLMIYSKKRNSKGKYPIDISLWGLNDN